MVVACAAGPDAIGRISTAGFHPLLPLSVRASRGWSGEELGFLVKATCSLVMSTPLGTNYLVEGITRIPSLPPPPPANFPGENLDLFGWTMVAPAVLLPS